MRRLKVDLAELEAALEDASWEMAHYLDLETGRVVAITDETRRELEAIYDETYDPDTETQVPLADVLPARDMPEWRKHALLEADQVETGYGSRYVRVPEADSHEGYRDMERFIATVQDERLQEHLWRAIGGRGAFRYFKDVLAEHPRERERWFEFKDARVRQRILEWLESAGIEPIVEPPPEPAQVPPSANVPAPPPARARLIAEALAFVQAARQLPGVIRIALIGSLTTDEPEPKDVDVLVTVTDEADLAPLATLGRKLAGHAQSFNRGGDVFLADPAGNYLGRTCPWKQCGPGIRMSCDALHCGRRPYLHDDLEAVRLPKDLIAAPPIELWPQVVARVPLPEDVEQGLIGPLREA
jgi:predicted nucleotidyltransferase